jgi:hypothetical protein
VGDVSGYAIDVEDLVDFCRKIDGEIAQITTYRDDLSASEVGRADFGGRRYDDVAVRYLEAVHGTLADSLQNLRSAGSTLTAGLLTTFKAYVDTDREGAETLERITGEGSGSRDELR